MIEQIVIGLLVLMNLVQFVLYHARTRDELDRLKMAKDNSQHQFDLGYQQGSQQTVQLVGRIVRNIKVSDE